MEYKTVKAFGIGEYEEKRSKFIGACIPVSSEEDAVRFINERKQQSFGARHNVYAYILRDNNIARYSDDGEPHSTAGMPTLEVLKKQGITDVCVVTTRYFGGVLLGTGGLVRAYTAAAKAAVEAAGIVVMKEGFVCNAVCSYSDYQVLCDLITENKGSVDDTAFAELVTVTFSVAELDFDRLNEKITDRFCGNITANIVKKAYIEVLF